MKFDIIIVGGGMVGATMACALSALPYKVALIDATAALSNDHRLIALNYSSICLLKNLNLWNSLQPHAAAIQEVHVSHRGHFGITRLRAAELALDALGFVIPAQYINTSLHNNLHNVTLIRPATVKALTQTLDQVILQVETAEGIKNCEAKIVIGADGTHSTLRHLLNIETTKTDYQQTALVTTTELSRSHNNIAYERFLQRGAIAMLPLRDHYAATIWTDESEKITELMAMNPETFLQQLQKKFGYRLGRFKNSSQRFTYPIQMVEAKQQSSQRVILIGNALHTLSPIAAQGLNLALHEIASLTEYLTKHSLDNITFAPFSTPQQKISTDLSHHLSWIFSHDFFIVNTARQLGMMGLDLCMPLKKRFIDKAIGRTGHLPSLLREQEFNETDRA